MTQTGSESLLRVASFTGPDCAGNDHRLRLAEKLLTTEQASALSQNIAPDILVDLAGEGQHRQVRFYHYGRPVADCGSGLVAASFAGPGDGCVQLQGSTHNSRLISHDTLHGYRRNCRPAFRSVRSSVAALVARVGGGPVRRVRRVRGSYIIAELASASAVAELRPKLALWRLLAGSALIVTAPLDSHERRRYQNAHVVLRYFAPQWGNPEDRATGSAAMLLTRYWWPRLAQKGVPWLKLRQLSAAGGQLYGRVEGNDVVVAGCCQRK